MKTKVFKTTPIQRNGLIDIWNAFMVENASFSKNDIPLCPTTAKKIPTRLIGYDEAKRIHRKMLRSGQKDYHINAFIHFYIDDNKFDSKQSSFWLYPQKTLEIIKHYDGMINPDPSTYADFPDPLKRWNFYRMNAFGFWVESQGYDVISNGRWNTPDTWDYCFDANPQNSMICIGTVASGLKYKANYKSFEEGLFKMVEVLSPHTIIVYGSSNYSCFDALRQQGINIVTFKSSTCEYYEGKNTNE